MENNPKVFISYAHKNQAYEDKVLELANRLRSEGIDAMIDQYEEAPPEGWPRWMEHQIMESEFVLVLCEETYYQKLYSEKKGKGVVWEANIVYQMLYDTAAETNKFIAVFFDDADQQYIPTPLKPYTYYNLLDEKQYDRLYWRFRGVTNSKKPPLGELKPLPEKERKTMFFSSPINLEKWNAAKWRGTVYLWGGDAPAIGLFFTNYSVGKEIFKEWKKKYKDMAFADTFLKVDYIVPPFPKSCWVYESYDRNYGKGYFLHIGANIDESISRANNCGIEMQQLLLATVSRYQWMDENNGSGNRDQFLDMYNKTGKYYLVPVGLKNPSMGAVMENMQFDFEYAIPMKEITVTAGTKITKENPCKAVLMEPEE